MRGKKKRKKTGEKHLTFFPARGFEGKLEICMHHAQDCSPPASAIIIVDGLNSKRTSRSLRFPGGTNYLGVKLKLPSGRCLRDFIGAGLGGQEEPMAQRTSSREREI